MTANKPLKAFYYLVLSLALVGQSTAAYKWVSLPGFIPAWGELAVIAGFVFFLELGAVVLLREVVARRGRGEAAAVPLIASATLVAIAAGITFAGHWGDKLPARISAIAFAAVTIGGYVVFLITTDLSEKPEFVRRRRVQLAVAEYVESLPGMSQRDKQVLLASTDAETIASRVTSRLDNNRIAEMLSEAIDPSGWDVPSNPDRPRKTSPVKNRPSPAPSRLPGQQTDVARQSASTPVPVSTDATNERPRFKDLPPDEKKAVTAEMCDALAAMADPTRPSPFPSQRKLAAHFNASKSEVNRLANREDVRPLVRVNGSKEPDDDGR